MKESAVLYNNLGATSIQTDRPAAALHYCKQALQVLGSQLNSILVSEVLKLKLQFADQQAACL